MHLIEGAEWSDGDPFDADDVMFYWNDNVQDPNASAVPPGTGTPERFGTETTLEAIDVYTIKWTFKESFPTQYLYAMAYDSFRPGPSHILKAEHPKYNPDNSYDNYKNAFPPEYMNIPLMGAWVPVEYRPDDIIVMHRNPYYWKVDEAGNQFSYLNEMHYRWSTWADRDVQAVAGSGDLSNLEQAESFAEALKRAAEDDSPARLQFDARTIGYALRMNMSANGQGEPDGRTQAVRELNRDLNFRKAVSIAIDRQRLVESLVRGPLTAIYPGGLYAGTTYYDKASTAHYPHDIKAANALLDDLNLGVIAQMESLGIRVIVNFQAGTARDDMTQPGQFDWTVESQGSEMVSAVQGTTQLAPTGPRTHPFHKTDSDDTVDLLPFEQELVDIINTFIASSDPAERAVLMKRYQQVFTENVYSMGLTQYPGELIINKRFANIPEEAPIFMFNWAEDNIICERVFVPQDQQQSYELHPEKLLGEPGGAGPK